MVALHHSVVAMDPWPAAVSRPVVVPERRWTHPLFQLDALYAAYRSCRSGKRGTCNALAFEVQQEEGLLALQTELRSGTWQPRPSRAFLVTKPKRREVFAADFRDRIVHHLLVGHLEPAWERRFIHDSFACRVGKGTHAGVDRLQSFCRQATANDTRPAWYLQLDIRGFFMAIDRRRLYQRLVRHCGDPVVQDLIGRLVFHDPVAGCRLRPGDRKEDFLRLPPHKTLFRSAPDCGLPIGNLTSQFFANVYLDALDQFVKHTLRATWYVRYCDDLVLLHRDPAVLVAWLPRIEAFVDTALGLTLHPRRRLRRVADGIDFLGYITRPGYRLVRRRVVGSLHDDLHRMLPAVHPLTMLIDTPGRGVWDCLTVPVAVQAAVATRLEAFRAHAVRAAAGRLQQRILHRHGALDVLLHQRVVGGPWRLRVPPSRLPAVGLHRLWFRTQAPQAVIVGAHGPWWWIDDLPGERGRARLPVRWPRRRGDVLRRLLLRLGRPVLWVFPTGPVLPDRIPRSVTTWWWPRPAPLSEHSAASSPAP
jgi:hypothetical protein